MGSIGKTYQTFPELDKNRTKHYQTFTDLARKKDKHAGKDYHSLNLPKTKTRKEDKHGCGHLTANQRGKKTDERRVGSTRTQVAEGRLLVEVTMKKNE